MSDIILILKDPLFNLHEEDKAGDNANSENLRNNRRFISDVYGSDLLRIQMISGYLLL